MNEHAQKMKAREEEREARFDQMLQDISEISCFLAWDLETPSPLRRDYAEALLSISEAHKRIKSLKSKIFS